MPLTTVLHIIALFSATVVMFGLALYGWVKRTTPAAPAFVWGMAADCAWTTIDLLAFLTGTPATILFWNKLGYLAVANVPLAWLTFALLYTGREKWVTRRNLLAVAAVPALMVVLVWTNDWHHLFWQQYQVVQRGGLTVAVVEFGLGGWLSILYTQTVLLISAGLIGVQLLRANRLYRVQTAWVLVGFLVPLAANAIYVFDLGPDQDLTTASFAVSGLLVAVGVFRFHLLDLVPIARDKAFEGMTDAVIVLDQHDRVVDLNPTAQRLLGQTPAKAVGQAAEHCFAMWPALAENYRAGPSPRREVTADRQAVTYTYDLHRVTLTDRRGRPTGSLLVLRDITERRRAELQAEQLNADLERRVQERTRELETTIQQLRQEMEDRQRAEAALRESEARYRTLVDISPDAIVLTDLGDHVIMANPQARVLFGLPSDADVQGEAGFGFVAPEDRDRARGDLQGTVTAGRLGTGEYTLQRSDGTQFVGEVSATLVPDNTGQPRALISVIRDVSERREAQAMLQRRTATLELLYEAGQAFNSTLDSDLVLTTVLDEVRRGLDALVCSIWLTDPATGEAVCRQATGPQSDVVRGWRLLPGKGIAGWIMKHGESVISANIQTDARHAAEVDEMTRLPLRSLLGVPLHGQRGTLGVIEAAHTEADHFTTDDRTFLELLSFTAVSAIENAGLYEQAQREIAQRRQAEETLSAANQRLQALSRQLVEVQETERRRLALELHDELGQMLNSIKLSLDLMPIDPVSETQEPLRRARRLISQLIQQVRQLALDLRPAMLDDLGLVPALKSFFRQQTAQTGLQVTFENGVPDSRRFPPSIETAAYRIIQEGVTNATRHADIRCINVVLQADERTLNLRVFDQGKGFDPAALPTQASSTGIAGMRERARLLGGDLVIESALGGGTRLYATLPVA